MSTPHSIWRKETMGGIPRTASSRARRPWSLRAQVLGTVLAINAVAALVAGTVVIVNARFAAKREMTASVEMAERMVQESAERLVSEPDASIESALPLHLRHLRHVRIALQDPSGRALSLPSPPEGSNDDNRAPDWFNRIVGVDAVARQIDLRANGTLLGRVTISGVPDDEVAEVWEDTRDFAAVAIAVNAAILLALYLALGRVRTDLGRLRGGLADLELNRPSCRVPPPRTRELAEVAERFNGLAQTLDAARAENAHLYARLVSLQEDERRQIAGELHDELGPLMFGLKAGADSLSRLARDAPEPLGGRMAARAGSLISIIERMQGTNRRLLRKIRPAALGHVALKDVLASLVAEFRQHDPERAFLFEAGTLADHYGAACDATLYRCAQEALTNALKHGDARSVRMTIHEVPREAGPVVRLEVVDDGRGLAEPMVEGLGLNGMRERARALGGICRLEPIPEGGARLLVQVPVAAATGRSEP